jgi:putative ABC transport system ATP-binding protein
VAIARATIMQPHILLADEPTGNLDRVSGNEVIDILETLNRQQITLIMVTHDPALGKRARRQINMVDGRIESDQCPSTIPNSLEKLAE